MESPTSGVELTGGATGERAQIAPQTRLWSARSQRVADNQQHQQQHKQHLQQQQQQQQQQQLQPQPQQRAQQRPGPAAAARSQWACLRGKSEGKRRRDRGQGKFGGAPEAARKCAHRDSVARELERIRMHERLLLGGQRRLVEQLRAGKLPAEPGQPPLAGLAAELRGKARGQLGVDMEPTEGAGRGLGQPESAAVECRELSYWRPGVGPLQRAKQILHGVSLTVPEGSIYGLLGPSGCGKTTLLRCVVGRLRPHPAAQSGSCPVRVFGYQPNEPGSRIPGPALGYMPQEVSLYDEFTIYETLTYFGRINGMRSHLLQARIAFLLKFLNLPTQRHRLVGALSGGQKRRVSLAVALVHSPPLLILDEPTVGVDPLLRQLIWSYLTTLATSAEKITIIITTHYIEEARQANCVGLMRAGRLLAENCPRELMRLLGMASLEHVFLRLCVEFDHLAAGEAGEPGDAREREDCDSDYERDDDDQQPGYESGQSRADPASTSSSQLTAAGDLEAPPGHALALQLPAGQLDAKAPALELGELLARGARVYKPMARGQKYAARAGGVCGWLAVLWAVTWKNYLRIKGNPAVVVFQLLLPAIQLVLFCLCIGGPPRDIPLAIVNEELVPQASRLFLKSIGGGDGGGGADSSANSADLSIPATASFIQLPQANLSAAIELVRQGRAWAAVHIPNGFTHHLQERLLNPADVDNVTLANGTITIYPDLTNLHLALAIEASFRQAFLAFGRSTLELLGYDAQLAELPVRLATPIYGRPLERLEGAGGYLEFMAPGVVISIVYVMATGLTALAFILENRDGLLERSQVAGVTTTQILLAHALLQVLVMALQIGVVLAVTFYLFAVPCEGPFGWAVALILGQGCTGMAFGLLISALCREENAAIMMLVGTFYVNLILAGIMWPVEAMPRWLRLLSYAQPQTLATESLRNILSRGWPISQAPVYLGFMVTLGWLLVFLLGAGLCMRYIK